MITLPTLPYALDALEPHISKETLQFHYDKHHRTYVDNLNKLLEASPLSGLSLEAIIQQSSGSIFNNAAQVWNHTFYWHCLSPVASKPSAVLQAAIERSFGSIEACIAKLIEVGLATFGSGWVWLVKKTDGSLEIMSTSNAGTPLTTAGLTPLLTCDVWEHAYYIDFRNARLKYLQMFPHIMNWDFASANFAV
jgi:Fe-Mn family superoxide dismutase